MEELVEEMEKRYQILEANQCPDLTTYNQKIGHKQNKVIPRIVCIFDEYANIVTPLIRSNLHGRIALKTASEADSSIILGGKQNNAAYLLGKGDLLYLKNGQLNRLQSLFLQHFSFTEN